MSSCSGSVSLSEGGGAGEGRGHSVSTFGQVAPMSRLSGGSGETSTRFYSCLFGGSLRPPLVSASALQAARAKQTRGRETRQARAAERCNRLVHILQRIDARCCGGTPAMEPSGCRFTVIALTKEREIRR